MKYVALVLFSFILVILISAAGPVTKVGYAAFPLDSPVSSLGAITSLTGSDVYYIVSSSASKKVTWSTIADAFRDSIENQKYTINKKWDFKSGATFSAGSNGTVDFYDTVVVNTPGGVFAIEGNAKQLVYGEMNFVSGAKHLVPAIGSVTTFRQLAYVGGDGSGQVVFNYGTSQTDTIVTKRGLRTDDQKFNGFFAQSLDSVALAGGTAGLAITANVMVIDGNAIPSSISLSAPTYDGQQLIIICPPSDTHGFTLIDTDGECELSGDANKSFTANDAMTLIGYDGVWYQTSALSAN